MKLFATMVSPETTSRSVPVGIELHHENILLWDEPCVHFVVNVVLCFVLEEYCCLKWRGVV